MIYAIGSMSAAQAEHVSRRHGLLLVHLRTGNYRFEQIPAQPRLSLTPTFLPVAGVAGAVAGFTKEAK